MFKLNDANEARNKKTVIIMNMVSVQIEWCERSEKQENCNYNEYGQCSNWMMRANLEPRKL